MIAIVTGGSRGIGKAIAETLAQSGHVVYICSQHRQRVKDAEAYFQAQGLPVQGCQLDITSLWDIEEVFERIFRDNGRIDMLVNSAGIAGVSDLESEQDVQLWNRIITTNLTGAYYCSRAAVLRMRENKWGRIVNIASVLGLRGIRNSTAYCAAKHGIVGFTRAMAQDVMPWNITVNAVCPGWVLTDMGRESMAAIARHHGIEPQQFENAEIESVPLGRWIEPHEVANMVKYLVSEEAAAITGQAFEISGGL